MVNIMQLQDKARTGNRPARIEASSIKRALLIFLMAVVFIWQGAGAAAAAEVEIKVRPGIAGLYRMEQPVRLIVSINNPAGEEFVGTVVVQQKTADGAITGRPGVPAYSSQVKVKPGSNNEITMLVPGELLAGPLSVTLLRDGQFVAAADVEGTNVGGGLVCLVLSEKASRSDLFTWMSKNMGNQFIVKYVNPSELSGDPLSLGVANYLVLAPENSAALNQDQIGAIKDWVRLGGALLLSGGAGSGPGGVFSDISPVLAGAPLSVKGSLGGLREGSGEIVALSGKATAGTVTAEYSGVPLLAGRDLSRGQVLYSAFAIEDLAGDNSKVWQSMELLSGTGDNMVRKKIDSRFMMRDMLLSSGAYLPMLKIPGTPLLYGLWVLYLLLVGPLIYLMLRRLDKRDWMWGAVPLAAVVAALGFYMLSPANRVQGYLVQTTTAMEILEPGLAEVYSASTVVMPRGGDLDVQGPRGMLVEPMRYEGTPGRGVQVNIEWPSTMVSYRGVEFGSLRQVSAYGLLKGSGGIEGSLQFSSGEVTGSLVNKTALDLKDCKLLLGWHMIELGEMKAGGRLEIKESLDKWQIVSDPQQIMQEPYPRGQDNPGQNPMLWDMTRRNYLQGQNGSMYFLGWSQSAPELFKIQKPSSGGQVSALTLVRQKIAVNFPKGKFKLPAGFVQGVVKEGGAETVPGGIRVHSDNVVIVYDINSVMGDKEFKVSGIEIAPGSDIEIEAQKAGSGDWVSMGSGGRLLSADEVGQFLTSRGTLTLKLSTKLPGNEKYMPSAYQGIAVEGEVLQ